MGARTCGAAGPEGTHGGTVMTNAGLGVANCLISSNTAQYEQDFACVNLLTRITLESDRNLLPALTLVTDFHAPYSATSIGTHSTRLRLLGQTEVEHRLPMTQLSAERRAEAGPHPGAVCGKAPVLCALLTGMSMGTALPLGTWCPGPRVVTM